MWSVDGTAGINRTSVILIEVYQMYSVWLLNKDLKILRDTRANLSISSGLDFGKASNSGEYLEHKEITIDEKPTIGQCKLPLTDP